jgi:hypothetical protein
LPLFSSDDLKDNRYPGAGFIVAAPGRSPVVVEAEYMPARTVEPEARSRLGLEVATNGRIIDYCVFTERAKDVQRFPKSGWLEGAVEDLADMVRLVSLKSEAPVFINVVHCGMWSPTAGQV